MSVVIIGGNECMACQYEKICKEHGCKAKVFIKESGCFKKQIGNPGLIVLFTNTVSHKMVKTAVDVARKNGIQVERLHTSSAVALDTLLSGVV